VERLGGFLPGKVACPARQKQHIDFGQGAFAVAPRNLFDDHGGATAAIDAPHGVQQEDEKSPERNELEAAFGKLVIAGRRLVAARANRRRTLAGSHGDFDALLVGTEMGVLIDKTPESVAAV